MPCDLASDCPAVSAFDVSHDQDTIIIVLASVNEQCMLQLHYDCHLSIFSNKANRFCDQ